ncbi:MAG: hypothetical protein IKV27_01905 [Lachnospiraceae bacterium]|nr:hypothetical protein [Lachnospiraceae bacterium]
MQELIRNGISGWFAYTDAGKYAVLFLGVLLCYWYRKAGAGPADEPKGHLWRLMIYASIMAAAVIFPLTAVLLMKYQTKFYDYKWLWSVVPVTLIIAYGAAGTYLEVCRSRWKGNVLKPAGLAAVGLAVIFLCGNLNVGSCEGADTATDKVRTVRILDKLAESGDTDTICLWAPREILVHVRGQNGQIQLLYGRNMWDVALNAYAYDVYDQETIALYEWMEGLTEGEATEFVKEEEWTAACVVLETALNKGVNCIVIPASSTAEVTEEISSCVTDVAAKMNLAVTLKETEGYDIYRLRSK